MQIQQLERESSSHPLLMQPSAMSKLQLAIEHRASDQKVPGHFPRTQRRVPILIIEMGMRLRVFLGKTLYAFFSHWAQAVYPLWCPSLTEDLQTHPHKCSVVLV